MGKSLSKDISKAADLWFEMSKNGGYDGKEMPIEDFKNACVAKKISLLKRDGTASTDQGIRLALNKHVAKVRTAFVEKGDFKTEEAAKEHFDAIFKTLKSPVVIEDFPDHWLS